MAAESEMVADESDADAEAEPLHLDCPDPNNLEALEQESEIFFRIANAHNNGVCIFAASSSQDKAQILNVTVAQCKDSGKTPREICQNVKNALIAYYEKKNTEEARERQRRAAAMDSQQGCPSTKFHAQLMERRQFQKCGLAQGRWHHRDSWMADAAPQHRLNVE